LGDVDHAAAIAADEPLSLKEQRERNRVLVTEISSSQSNSATYTVDISPILQPPLPPAG
jgi:hypothetical protein